MLEKELSFFEKNKERVLGPTEVSEGTRISLKAVTNTISILVKTRELERQLDKDEKPTGKYRYVKGDVLSIKEELMQMSQMDPGMPLSIHAMILLTAEVRELKEVIENGNKQ